MAFGRKNHYFQVYVGTHASSNIYALVTSVLEMFCCKASVGRFSWADGMFSDIWDGANVSREASMLMMDSIAPD